MNNFKKLLDEAFKKGQVYIVTDELSVGDPEDAYDDFGTEKISVGTKVKIAEIGKVHGTPLYRLELVKNDDFGNDFGWIAAHNFETCVKKG